MSLPRTVLILGIISFFTDFSSEMIYPLLPVFLSSVLNAGPFALGLIEGIAESTASILKIFSGFWTDSTGKRKPFILFGYGLAGFARPWIGLAQAWPAVLGIRFIDRVGKGIRSSPRDALIADVTIPEVRGKAYGFHRSMDHAGAVIGPLVAAGLLALPPHLFGIQFNLRKVFLLAAIPGLIAWLILFLFLKEKETPHSISPEIKSKFHFKEHWNQLGTPFKILLLALSVFTLGNSTDAFLLVQLSKNGVTPSLISILWAGHHLVKMGSNYWGGQFSDKIGHKKMILIGWIFFALIYLGFSQVESKNPLILIFLAYGLYYGLVEPAEKAWVASVVPTQLRGSAFGYYNLVIGLGALPASLLFGWIAEKWGAPWAFGMGSGLALVASLILLGSQSSSNFPTPINEYISNRGFKSKAISKVLLIFRGQ